MRSFEWLAHIAGVIANPEVPQTHALLGPMDISAAYLVTELSSSLTASRLWSHGLYGRPFPHALQPALQQRYQDVVAHPRITSIVKHYLACGIRRRVPHKATWLGEFVIFFWRLFLSSFSLSLLDLCPNIFFRSDASRLELTTGRIVRRCTRYSNWVAESNKTKSCIAHTSPSQLDCCSLYFSLRFGDHFMIIPKLRFLPKQARLWMSWRQNGILM